MAFYHFHYSLKASTEIIPKNVTKTTPDHFLPNCIFTVYFSWRYGTAHPNGTVQAEFSLDVEGCSI
jgi:hypothetical protein